MQQASLFEELADNAKAVTKSKTSGALRQTEREPTAPASRPCPNPAPVRVSVASTSHDERQLRMAGLSQIVGVGGLLGVMNTGGA
jgi:hypothetical protein